MNDKRSLPETLAKKKKNKVTETFKYKSSFCYGSLKELLVCMTRGDNERSG